VLNLVFAACNPALVGEYCYKIARFPNIANPSSLHEKYLWRKIVDRDPRFTMLSDKLLLKSWLAKRFPNVNFAKVIWVGRDVRSAPKEALCRPGYLKANHASGTNVRLTGDTPDLGRLHRQTQKWLSLRWHKKHGEWGYAGVNPCLFIEQAIEPHTDLDVLLDLTIYVFCDQVTHIAAMTNHKSDQTRFGRFDADGNRMALGTYPSQRMERLSRGPNQNRFATLPDDFQLPIETKEMIALAKHIAKGFDHLRIDFLWNGRLFYITEITIYSQGGFLLYSDQQLLGRMAEAWDLEASWLFTTNQKGWRKHYAEWLRARLRNLKNDSSTHLSLRKGS
jgi:hypothetical protein